MTMDLTGIFILEKKCHVIEDDNGAHIKVGDFVKVRSRAHHNLQSRMLLVTEEINDVMFLTAEGAVVDLVHSQIVYVNGRSFDVKNTLL